MDEVVETVLRRERVVTDTDFNGHILEGTELMRWCWVGLVLRREMQKDTC